MKKLIGFTVMMTLLGSLSLMAQTRRPDAIATQRMEAARIHQARLDAVADQRIQAVRIQNARSEFDRRRDERRRYDYRVKKHQQERRRYDALHDDRQESRRQYNVAAEPDNI